MDFISYWIGVDWVCLQSGLGGVEMGSVIQDGNPWVQNLRSPSFQRVEGEQLDSAAAMSVMA
jgi:hypothetical protein